MDLDAMEADARRRMSAHAYDYYAGGADDELTLLDNAEAWRRLRLRPHILRDVAAVDASTTVLGTPVAAPVLVAPVAAHRMAHAEGERDTARGAAAAGSLFIVSSLASVALDEVAAAAPGAPQWFQVYLRRDRGWVRELVERAVAAGYRALVLTVDLPVLGRRRRDDRHPPGLPAGVELANFASRGGDHGRWVAATARDDLDASLTVDDLAWLRGLSDLPVVVKGVLRGDDARACMQAGAAGVVVSNHGGRQLDTAVAGIDALPEVVDAVAGDGEVYVDGGVRSGTDVVKALALGARAVLVGRPVLWALATGGAEGVEGFLNGLREETLRAMALCGATSTGELTSDLVAWPGWPWDRIDGGHRREP